MSGDGPSDARRELEVLVAEAARTRLEEMKPQWEQALQMDAERAKRRAERQPAVRAVGDDTPRGQHFIPRYWVVGFAEPPTRAGKVMTVDVFGRKQPRRVGTKAAAAEEHFYTLTDASGERTVALEDALGLLENDAAPAFQRMAAGSLPSALLERLDVSFLLAAQAVRTPESLRLIEGVTSGLNRKIVQMAQQAGELPPIEGEFTVGVDRQYLLGVALRDKALTMCAFFLFCRRWSLVRAAKSSCGFVLPERPVAPYSATRSGFYGPGGLPTAHEVLVPVSRRILLLMHWMDVSNADGMEVPADLVTEVNSHLSGLGGPTVFCAPSDLEAVVEMLVRQAPHDDVGEESQVRRL